MKTAGEGRPSVRHHYVPRWYLKRFTKDGNVLWMYQRDKPEPVQVSVNNSAVEKFLYSTEQASGDGIDAMERALADIVDGPAVEPIERLANGATLSEDERTRVAIFLAVQELRTPAARDRVLELLSEQLHHLGIRLTENRERVKAVLKDLGQPITDEIVGLMNRGLREGKIKVTARKEVWLREVARAVERASVIGSLRWITAVAPANIEFVTCDHPLSKVLTDASVPRLFAGGWCSPSAEARFPLDPSCCLVIRPENGDDERREVPLEYCLDVNAVTVSWCNRAVYARSRDDAIEKHLGDEEGCSGCPR